MDKDLAPRHTSAESAETAEMAGTKVEVLSGDTEEGQMLKKSFGGVAAILRYKAAN